MSKSKFVAILALAIMAAPSSAATIQSVDIHTPANIAGSYAAAGAQFGPQTFSITGQVELANDGVGPSTSDACTPLTNLVAGRIALIDRGTCAFTTKVKNAQNAGAIGVIIANNVAGLTGMGGTDPTIVIPSLMVTKATGDLIKGALASGAAVTATLNRFQAPPASVILSPTQATNTVGEQHCVTATVTDASGQPFANVDVVFSVSGATTAGPETRQTDVNGQAMFCYMGPPLPGADVITAFADTNSNGTQDVGEASGAASKTWVAPVTTPGCEILIIDNGRITAANGDPAKFHGTARASATGVTSGNHRYEDLGPVQPLTVEAINVQTIVCEGTTRASIYGQATINGAGSFFYRINVQDLGEPGQGRDTYWILLQTGYTSGEQMLEGGNVQIRRTQ